MWIKKSELLANHRDSGFDNPVLEYFEDDNDPFVVDYEIKNFYSLYSSKTLFLLKKEIKNNSSLCFDLIKRSKPVKIVPISKKKLKQAESIRKTQEKVIEKVKEYQKVYQKAYREKKKLEGKKF